MAEFSGLEALAAKRTASAPVAAAPPPTVAAASDGAFSGLEALAGQRRTGGTAVGNALVGAGASVASGLGRALDTQRFHLAKAAGLGATTDDQMTALRTKLGIESDYQDPRLFGVIPQPDWLVHAERGAVDTALQTLTDPLTYETLGAAPVLRAIGAAGKIGPAAMKVINSKPALSWIYDQLHWGGAVAREHGTAALNRIRGGTIQAAGAGAEAQEHIMAGFRSATKDLTEPERVRVGQALNGRIPVTAEDAARFVHPGTEREVEGEATTTVKPEEGAEPPLTNKERAAYTALRRLTEQDYAQRYQAATALAFKNLTTDLSARDRAEIAKWLRAGHAADIPKPTPRVRKEYGEPVARSREIPPKPPFDVKATFDQQMKDLSPEQADLLRKAWVAGNNANAAGLKPEFAAAVHAVEQNPALKARLDAIQRAVLGQYTMGPERAFQDLAPKRKFTFKVGNAEEIKRLTALRDRYDKIVVNVQQAIPKREDYMPWFHQGVQDAEEGRAERRYNPLENEARDVRAQPRPDIYVTKPEQLERGFQAMADNLGRVVEGHVLRQNLAEFAESPAVRKLFERVIPATGAHRDDLQKLRDTWMKVLGYPRAATVSMTPRHAINILDLAMNTVPPERAAQYAKDTMTLAAKLVAAKSPEDYAALTKEGRELGVHAGATFAEHEPFFQHFPDWMPLVGGKSTGPLGGWTRLMNRMTWAVDAAAKQEYAKILVETGEAKGLEAGGLANQRLVDYRNLSPLQKALRYVAPFGTFRGGVPGAVLGGVARNPARAALYNRASGGALYGGRPDYGQQGATMYNPTADIGRALGDPREYVRSTLGAPVQAGLTLAAEAAAGHPGASIGTTLGEVRDLPAELAKAPGQIAQGQMPTLLPKPERASDYRTATDLHLVRYLNYGNPVDLRWLLGASAAGVIEARDALEELGYGQFRQRPGTVLERAGKEALQQAAGVGLR